MTREEHIERHKQLHRSLDELLADWITNSGLEHPLPSKHTIFELAQWSHEQTKNPTPDKYDKEQTPPTKKNQHEYRRRISIEILKGK